MLQVNMVNEDKLWCNNVRKQKWRQEKKKQRKGARKENRSFPCFGAIAVIHRHLPSFTVSAQNNNYPHDYGVWEMVNERKS